MLVLPISSYVALKGSSAQSKSSAARSSAEKNLPSHENKFCCRRLFFRKTFASEFFSRVNISIKIFFCQSLDFETRSERKRRDDVTVLIVLAIVMQLNRGTRSSLA